MVYDLEFTTPCWSATSSLPILEGDKQGWQPAFTAGIIRRLKPDKTGPDNTPKGGFYRILLAFAIFLLFSSTKIVLTFYMFIK